MAPLHLKDHPIVCFSAGDWWALNPGAFDRKMIEFAKYTKILYINTVSIGMPRILSRSFFVRLRRKMKSLARVLRQPLPGLYVFTPIILPFSKSNLLQLFNTTFLLVQIRILFFLLRIRDPILWVGNLGAVGTLPKLKGKLVVYDCTDKFDKSRYIKAKELMKSLDEVMVEQADLIICVSKPLFRYYQSKASHKVHYLPHGVDFEHFASHEYKPQQPPLELRNIPHPIIGYYGTLTEANDIELLQHCVKHRPEWSFVLVGNITEGDYRSVLAFPNVHALGYKPYEELPAYAACFDVCILFWKVYDWIQFCSPLKTKEYLALGKPVVSVRIPEIEEEFSDVISVASNKLEFLDALGYELRTDSPEKTRLRQAKVHNFTWSEYVAKVSDLLMEAGENETN